MILLADSEGPDQTAQLSSLIWAFAVRIHAKKRFRMARPISTTTLSVVTDRCKQSIDPDQTLRTRRQIRVCTVCHSFSSVLLKRLHKLKWICSNFRS